MKRPNKLMDMLRKRYPKSPVSRLVDVDAVRDDGAELRRTVSKINRDPSYDPGFKWYIIAQNVLSFFLEDVSDHRGMNAFFNAVEDLENRYMPSGPPMSPLTRSYFNYWLFFDYPFGKLRETAGRLFYDLVRNTQLDKRIITAVDYLNRSRMGLYTVTGVDGKIISLRELLTDAAVQAASPAGYPGKKGEILFARMAPHAIDPGGFSFILNTPYVILRTPLEDWLMFFERQGLRREDAGFEEKWRRFFKNGPHDVFWHEYLLDGYVNFEPSHIYLTGIPDAPGSLPHAGE